MFYFNSKNEAGGKFSYVKYPDFYCGNLLFQRTKFKFNQELSLKEKYIVPILSMATVSHILYHSFIRRHAKKPKIYQ